MISGPALKYHVDNMEYAGFKWIFSFIFSTAVKQMLGVKVTEFKKRMNTFVLQDILYLFESLAF